MKALVLAVLTAVYLYQLVLTVIHMRSASNPIPENVQDVYDRETYQQWRAYHAEKSRFSLFSGAVSFLVELTLFACNAYAWFAGLFPSGGFMQMSAVLILSSLSSVLMIPFAWHQTMVIEQKYGFNRSTPATFWADQAKEWLIGLVLMIGIGSLLMWAHRALGDWLIPAFTLMMTCFMLAVSFLYPFLSRIFNRFTPLEDGELKERLTALLEKNGYQVRAIQIMDASRRTTKSNAYFSGFGKMKTIVLFDNLVRTMTVGEICAVFAHEMGHGLHRDTLRNQLLSMLRMAFLGVLAWLTLGTPELFESFGFSDINYGFAMMLIMSVEYALLSPLFELVANAFSRRAEYRADAQAVKEGCGEELVSALKKLARGNFADLAPSPVLVTLEYSHPTLSQRIAAIRGGEASGTGNGGAP